MSRRTRLILALIGLLLLAASIAALTYAFAPVGVLHETNPIAPTLLVVPAGGAP